MPWIVCAFETIFVLELCACVMAWHATWLWPCGSAVRVEQGYTSNSELMICSIVNISGREHMVLGYNLPLKVKEEHTHTHKELTFRMLI